ncbi:olfactomedin-4 isoform X2 [Engraulis encrasicolus]|uniref:olfactomedin-4 isoform X2 n=1 Tax=Engraulis encrasicolus TaxID=184585 RepID=UPI002FCE8F81
MLIFLVIFSLTQTPVYTSVSDSSHTQRVTGQQKNGACVCDVRSLAWTFPAIKYENVSGLVEDCGHALETLQTQVEETKATMPNLLATVENVTRRLGPFQYLNSNGLYNALHLKQLGDELQDLQEIIGVAHNDNPSKETRQLTTDIADAKEKIEKMYKDNVFNLETVKENLRRLNNRVQSCRTISSEFRSTCSQRLMTNISSPVVTKLSSYGKSYISGAWGREADPDSEERYWVQPLTSGHRSGNIIRLYSSFSDFMAVKDPKDEPVAPSNTHTNAIQGPSTVLYGEAVFYECYNTGELCRYDLNTKATLRKTLPNAGFNNKFPFCYYTCRDWSDMTLSADEQGLWVIYSTLGDHGNLVVSRLDAESLNVTHTWKTHLFKKSATSAFMVCGVLYATRYVDTYREEVFYAFDTATGHEDNSLALPLEKVAAGVANLQYNPVDRRLYMYNDGYLLAYQAMF